MIRLTVPGDPVPQGRQRFFRRGNFVGSYQPAESHDFKNRVALFAKQAMVEMLPPPVTVKLNFYFTRPKKYLAKKYSVDAIACAVRPDVDNLCKAVLDALNGIAWRDDGGIWMVEARKWYHEIGGSPRTEIEAY